jgi:hypothetical protein
MRSWPRSVAAARRRRSRRLPNGKINVGIDASTIQLAPLTVAVLSGSVDPNTLAALQSPAMASIISNGLRAFPILGVPVPVTSATIDYQEHNVGFPAGSSLFDWFELKATASRIIVRPLEGALVAGVDFAGLTSGEPAQLLDLTRVRGVGSTYRWTLPAFGRPDDFDLLCSAWASLRSRALLSPRMSSLTA